MRNVSTLAAAALLALSLATATPARAEAIAVAGVQLDGEFSGLVPQVALTGWLALGPLELAAGFQEGHGSLPGSDEPLRSGWARVRLPIERRPEQTFGLGAGVGRGAFALHTNEAFVGTALSLELYGRFTIPAASGGQGGLYVAGGVAVSRLVDGTHYTCSDLSWVGPCDAYRERDSYDPTESKNDVDLTVSLGMAF